MTTYITPDGSPTAGPVDPNAGMRGKLYAGLAVITPLLGFLATFNIVTTEQGNAITGFITAAMGLLGVFGFGLAASKTSKQVKNGTFEAAPQLPAVGALEQLAILRDQADAEVNRGVAAAQAGADAIQAVATGVAKSLGTPSAVTGVGNAAFDAVQELIRRATDKVG